MSMVGMTHAPTLVACREGLPASIRSFCERVGLAKRENIIEMELLEFCLREDLNKCVLAQTWGP